MTEAKIQPFCIANGIKLGYFDGTRVFPRSVKDRKIALFLYINHFCLIWKSENVSFDQTIKELKDKFKNVDNFITEENNNSHYKYDFIPKKIESHRINFIVYDLETYNTDKTTTYFISFYH